MAGSASSGGGERVREEVLNVHLESLLRSRGLSARAERRSGGDVPDMRVDLSSGEQILIECKWDGGESLLDAQLEQRTAEFPEAIGRLGLLYPRRLQTAVDAAEALGAADDLRWYLHSSRETVYREPLIRRGTVADLADYLRAVPLEVEGYDRVAAAADAVRYAVEQAASQISTHANIAHRIAAAIAEADKERDRAAALRIGCLVLFNALAFQERLAVVNADVPTVSELADGGADSYRATWLMICDQIDYVPVFELAADLLEILNDAPAATQTAALGPLITAVRQTERVEGHDLSGRLFHTLLTDAKFTGAYYTSIPAATMLARLVFEGWPAGIDWADHELPAALNIADLACGTGTLLMAVAAEAQRRHEVAGGRRTAELHQALVEQALHGYDVQLSAVHFAATTLAMLNPRIVFDRLNLYVMPLGVSGEEVSLGSLDFLGTGEAAVQHVLSENAFGVSRQEPERVSGSGRRSASDGATVRLPELDLAIMNPPFTRAGQMLFGMLPDEQRRKVQRELSARLRSRAGSAVSGLGAAFVAAASPRLRSDDGGGGGRLALVLPLTLCTGSSWQQTRSLIERDFRLDMVITSHDPERWNFSESTDLSEVLMIATRRGGGEPLAEARTTYVQLWRNPDGVLDAQRVAQAVAATEPAPIESAGTALLSVDGRHVGESVSIPMRRFAGRQWAGVQFSRADLIRTALKLSETGEVHLPGGGEASRVPVCPLSELGSIGPDRRDILDGFDQTDAVTAYPMVAGNDTERWRALSAQPNRYLAPLVQARPRRRLKPASTLWSMASRLIVAERLWLNTTRVLAMRSSQPVLSNVWWEVQLDDEEAEKALAVWLNSSLGLTALLSQRTSTRGGWIANKKAELAQLPVLDTRALTSSQRERLAALFDSAAELEFERLPAMADCAARAVLDNGVSAILGLPDLGVLRRLLASEPVVSNQRL